MTESGRPATAFAFRAPWNGAKHLRMTAPGPVLDIDLDALVANFQLFQRLARESRSGAEAAAVVKCDAYGIGLDPVARVLRDAGARTFFVAYGSEGAALRDGLGDPDRRIIALMGPLSAPDARAMIAAGIAATINTPDQAALWAEAARASGAPRPCALHVDTAMHRLGLGRAEFEALLADESFRSAAPPTLLMTHLADGFDPASPRNAEQIAAFNEIAARLPEAETSLAASGGLFLEPPAGADLARIGVSLYGVGPQDAPDARLACVARLTAPVIQIADLLPGERVGYGGEFRAERPTRAATLAIGYGDGLPRSAGGAASVRLRGATVPIIGRVSMDLTVIDATDVPDLKPGDLAEVFGPSAPIETFAADASAIAYEILTGLGGRVRRRYWKEGAQIAP